MTRSAYVALALVFLLGMVAFTAVRAQSSTSFGLRLERDWQRRRKLAIEQFCGEWHVRAISIQPA